MFSSLAGLQSSLSRVQCYRTMASGSNSRPTAKARLAPPESAQRPRQSTQVLSSVVLARHGARFPSSGVLKRLPRCEAISQWNGALILSSIFSDSPHQQTSADQQDSLTTIGSVQGCAFGRFLRSGVLNGSAQAQKDCRLAGWRSSSSGRVLKSGTAVTSQFDCDQQPIIDSSSDDRFQLWGQRLDFKQWVDEHVKEGQEMQLLAAKHADLLREVWSQATDGVVQVDVSDSRSCSSAEGAGGVVWSALHAAWHCTYLHELLSCETHHASNQHMMLDGRLFGGCGESWRQHWHPPLQAPLCALIQRLSPKHQAFIQRCACYVWEQRFLANKQSGAVGMPLLKQAVADLQTSKGADQNTWLYSGHDYSLLVVLAALRQHEYPPHALSFGAFLRIQLVSVDGLESIRVSLCCDPFPLAACGFAAHIGPIKEQCLVADLPLEAIEYMLATASSVAWPLAAGAAAAAAAAGGTAEGLLAGDGAADDL